MIKFHYGPVSEPKTGSKNGSTLNKSLKIELAHKVSSIGELYTELFSKFSKFLRAILSS
jgi:hypothetical protein